MEMYCVCGYPIYLEGRLDGPGSGAAYRILCYDGYLGTASGPLVVCPGCGHTLDVRRLQAEPPLTLAWPPARASVPADHADREVAPQA